MTVREISPLELRERLDRAEDLFLLDVREPPEREVATIGGELIPVKEVLERAGEIPRDKTVVVYCRSGGRSMRAVEALQRERGFTNLWNLSGGISRWKKEVDPSIATY